MKNYIKTLNEKGYHSICKQCLKEGKRSTRIRKKSVITNEVGRNCVTCKTFKPFDKFNKDKKGKFGYNARCRECANIVNDNYRRKKGITVGIKYLITDEGRECTSCNEFKPYEEFNKDTKRKNGYSALCKRCNQIYLENARRKKGMKPQKVYLITEEGRECTKCLTFKPFSDFFKNSGSKCGHDSQCRECKRKPKKPHRYLITDEGRECTKCNEFKLFNEFHKGSSAKGFKTTCKQCCSKPKKPPKYLITEEGRECSKCLIFKPFSEFNKRDKEKVKLVISHSVKNVIKNII